MLLKYCGVVLSLAAGLLANGQAKKVVVKNAYTLTGKITDLKEGKVYLSSGDGEEKVLDSAQLKNGVFVFKGPLSEPLWYTLRIAGEQRGQRGFFLQPGLTTITGSKDSLYTAKLTGSKVNDQWKEWTESWSKITRQAGPMYRRLDSATKAGTEGKPSAEERQVFDDGMASLNKQTADAVTAFVTKYPESPVSAFIITDRFVNYPNPEMRDKTFSLLNAKGKNSFYGKQISEFVRIAAKTGIGAKPDFSLADTAGNIFKLSSLKGKYVLVDFWASWCAPCRKENPNVVAAYQKYHDKGFDIVGVSLDNKKEPWLKAIAKDSLTWTHVSDLKGWESGIVSEYGIKSVPTSFLIDKDGVVIGNNLRGEDLPKKLEQLLGK